MYSGPMRLLRALMLSATCVALSFGAHLVGARSGMLTVSLVAVVGLVMVTLLLTVVLAALSGRRWTLGRSLVALALGQVVLNAVFTVILSSHHDDSAAGMTSGASMAIAHGAVVLLIAVGMSVSEKSMDTFFGIKSSLTGSGVRLFAPWRLTSLVAAVDPAPAVLAAGRDRRPGRWQHPGILTDLVVLQCLSRRGPPELALVS
jgi:hypothetical protein